MYDYLIKEYGTDTPILVSEVSVPDMSQNTVRQYFMRLCRDGKLKRYDTGVYYIPTKTVFGTDSTLSRNQVIQKKYLETKDGEVCGFYTGMQLLNSVGLTTQVPAVYEISTNAASKDYREVNITGVRIALIKPRTEITKENCDVLQFLDLLLAADTAAEVSEEECKKIFGLCKKRMNITKEKVKKNIIYYPERIYRCLYEREVF